MTGKKVFSLVNFLLIATVAVGGCKKSGSSDSGSAGSDRASALDGEAQAAAMGEIQKHWAKGPDGWTTARVSGSAYAPDRYIRQMRELTVQGVQSSELTDSDRLNGMEWAGEVTFKSAPCREAGDAGLLLEGMSNLGLSVNRQRGRWTQWVDFQPEAIRVQKVKGQWQAQQDTWLLRGAIPQPADYANAGVK
ncbi:MAG TPA: hypothetical protein VK797_19345 [Tepidisphaeraceae bacterium]|nr:hypothetical protein [Tepidisphaeraceae bacterium]